MAIALITAKILAQLPHRPSPMSSRSHANHRGQSSNLYALILLEQAPTPSEDNTHDHEDNIDAFTGNTATATTVTHIDFATPQGKKQMQAATGTAPTPCNYARLPKPQKPVNTAPLTPVPFAPFTLPLFHPLLKQEKKAEQFLSCNSSFYRWTRCQQRLTKPFILTVDWPRLNLMFHISLWYFFNLTIK